MSNAREGFDAIGIVIHWIDACKQRRLDDLLHLYDETATVECCEGGSFQGRAAMTWYWGQRLATSGADAFEIHALMPDGDGVSLDYRGYDGKRVRTHFRFTGCRKNPAHGLRADQRGRLVPRLSGPVRDGRYSAFTAPPCQTALSRRRWTGLLGAV
jgi:hypothetical protein